MTLEFKMLSKDNIDVYFEHIVRLLNENGQPGTPYYTTSTPELYLEKKDRILAFWATPETELGFSRTWASFDNNNIIGNVELTQSKIPQESHRVMLGMGIEITHRKQGLGRSYIEHCISWSREKGFTWIDLSVLSSNEVAKSLYTKFGFIESGRKPDAYRFKDISIDLINMNLKLN